MAQSFVFVGNAQGCMPLAAKLMQAGYRNAEDLEAAEVVCVYCVGQSLHEDVFFEERGLLAQLDSGTLVIDFSPATPNLAKEIFAMASLSGIDYVEAPISLADISSAEGYADSQNVIVRMAGEKKATEAALPLLEALSDIVMHCGKAGTAQLAKCMDSLQVAAQVSCTVESQALVAAAAQAEGAGVEDLMGEGFAEGMAASDPFAAAVFAGEYRTQSGYTLETFLAEIAAAQLAAEDLGMVLPAAQSIQYVAELLASAGGAQLSPAGMALAYGEGDASRVFGVDWSRLEGSHAHSHDCDCDDEECDCGHDHGQDCSCGKHGEQDGQDWTDEDADEDFFRLDFDGVDAFDAQSYGDHPYPIEMIPGNDDDWASN